MSFATATPATPTPFTQPSSSPLSSSPAWDADKRQLARLITQLMAEVRTSRQQVKELTAQLDVQRSIAKTRLKEAHQDRNVLKRKVVELQKKMDERPRTPKVDKEIYDDKTVLMSNHRLCIPINVHSSTDGTNTNESKSRLHQHSTISSGSNNGSTSYPESTKKLSAKTRQQRLTLLRHASKCTSPNCTVTRHCSQMKAVWNHILEDDCTNPECGVKHCLSSRRVLSQFRRCLHEKKEKKRQQK